MAAATDTLLSGADGMVKTAILAGSGRLPELLAIELRDKGNPPLCVSIDGEAGPWIKSYDHLTVKSVQAGVLVRELKGRGVKRAVLAGGMGRPSLSSIRLDWVTVTNFFRFYRVLGKGDDALLRCVIGMLEAQGFSVVGAHEILPGLIAPKSVLTRKQPSEADIADRELAISAALANGSKDLGQAAVAVSGKVAAVEDAKGTDAMLRRMGDLRSSRQSAPAAGVLAKAAKPQQEHRADLPSIGPETVDNAVRAGLAGIAVSAGTSLILDRDEVIRRADAAGIFIEGCDMDAKG
jgi:UDP-2,3-diacylglucosamine hydrolase